jgi:hypothetical protein
VYVEVICTDQTVLDYNMQQKIQNSPDFSGMDFATALSDLKLRIANYEKVSGGSDRKREDMMDSRNSAHAAVDIFDC